MRHRATAGLLVCMALLAGCKTLDRKDTGLILVGSPQVVTRERLINDRLQQEKWLKDQLTLDSVNFTAFQGASDVRSFVGLSAGLGINANPLEQQAYRTESADYLASLERQRAAAERQEEIAQLEHEIALEKKRQALAAERAKSLEALPVASEAEGGGSTGPPPTRPTPPGGEAVPDTEKFLGRLTGEGREKLLPSAATLATAEKVSGSPIDIFRDKLAYREEIRAEMLENALDDRHDLGGNTAYRLTFGATVLPSEGVRDWAAVNVKISAPGETPQFSNWLAAFERAFKLGFLKHLLQFERCARLDSPCALPDDLVVRLLAYSKCPTANVDLQMTLLQQGDALKPPGENWVWLQPRSLNLARSPVNREQLESEIRTLARSLTVKERRAELLAALWRLEVDETELKEIVERRPLGNEDDFEVVEKAQQGNSKAGATLFEDKLGDAKKVLFAYSVTPKESVQKISEIEGSRRAIELAASLGVLTGQASIKGAVGYIRETQKLLQGIRRQPLVVGFIGAPDDSSQYDATSEIRIGWLIGPKFDSQTLLTKAPRFSQVPIQNNLSAVIAVPAWFKKVKVTIEPEWVDPQNFKGTAATEGNFKEFNIELPGDDLAVTEVLRTDRQPRVFESQNFTLVKGQPARLLIPGINLWRGTVVTLGGQAANKIQVLSELDGIIATFDAVSEPFGVNIPVRVWTSTGVVSAGVASIVKEEKEPEKFAIKLVTTRLVAGPGEEIELKVVGGAVPVGFSDAKIGIRPAGRRDLPWIFSEAKVDGNKITANPPKGPDGKALSYSSGQKLDVYLSIQLRDEPAQNDIHVTAKEKPIFYRNADAAKVIVSVTGAVKPKDQIRFTFPANALDAFPGFDANVKVILRRDTARELLSGTLQSATEPWYFDATLPELAAGTYELVLEPELPGLKFSQTAIEVKK